MTTVTQWTSGTAYTVGNETYYNDAVYLSLNNFTSTTAPNLDPTNWRPIYVAGPPGPQGPQGPAGASAGSIPTDAAVNVGSLRTLGTLTQQAASGNDARITGALQAANNLSDLASVSAARTSLGLGAAALASIGFASGNVPPGSQVVKQGDQAISVLDYGAKCDGVRLNNVTANTASNTVNVTGGSFVSGDVGKIVVLGTDAYVGPLLTISTVVSATQITVSAAAGVTISGANAWIYYGSDDSAAIQAALTAAGTAANVTTTSGANISMGSGQRQVVFPVKPGTQGFYFISSAITVPYGVRVDASGMIVNVLADRFAPCVIFQQYTSFERFSVECLFGSGVQLGQVGNAQADVYGQTLIVWRGGRDVEGVTPYRKKTGVALLGQNFLLNQVWVKGFEVGISGNQCSDTVINAGFVIGAHSPVIVNDSNQAILNLVFDTCGEDTPGYSGLTLDNNNSHIKAYVHAFEVVGVVHTLDAVVDVGPVSTNLNRDIYVEVQAQRTGGIVARLANAQDMTVRVRGSNTVSGATGGVNIVTGVAYGTGLTGSIRVEVEHLSGGIAPYSGTRFGSYTDAYGVLADGIAANGLNLITAGEEILPRLNASSNIALAASGTLHLTYFTARESETITQVVTETAGTAAAGLTIARIGIYTVAGNGDLTLAYSTANDTTLWNTPYNQFTRNLTVAFPKVRGQRYAVGVIAVGTTMPQVTNAFTTGAAGSLAPRICGIVAGQVNLPGTVANGTVVGDYRAFQTVLLR